MDDSADIPFEVEIEHTEARGSNRFDVTANCLKNPLHQDFYLFKDLEVQHLGIYADEQLLSYIKYMGRRTVRVNVHHADGSMENATGFVCKRDQQVYVVTNSHVINSSTLAQNCSIDFNYEEENQLNIMNVRGTELRSNDDNRDYCQVYFDRYPVQHIIDAIVDLWDYNVKIKFPGTSEEEMYYILMLDGEYVIQTTHLKDCVVLSDEIIEVKFHDGHASRISEIYKTTDLYTFLKFNPVPQWLQEKKEAILPVLNMYGTKAILTIAISHPHGNPKSVSIGLQMDVKDGGYQLYHSSMTCKGSSGAPVFRIGLHDIGKFPRTMLFTHSEGFRTHQYKGKAITSRNLNKAVLNTRRPKQTQHSSAQEN